MTTTFFGSSGDNRIDSLVILYPWTDQGTKWGGALGSGTTVTFSFPIRSSKWESNYSSDKEPTTGFKGLKNHQKNAVREALASWSAVADIDFVQVADNAYNPGGELRFGFSKALGKNTAAWAYFPEDYGAAGDVWFNNDYRSTNFSADNFVYSTLVHEIGHAIGLNHTHDGIKASLSYDWAGFSVMAYRTFVGAKVNSATADRFPTTPMLHDILAVQYMYGPNYDHNSGDTNYRWSKGEGILETIWDGGGYDTIDWSNQSTSAVINLNSGVWSKLGPAYRVRDNSTSWHKEKNTLMIAYDTDIEAAKGGSKGDWIIGNGLDNTLLGMNGADNLFGRNGNDLLIGGKMNDLLEGENGNDYMIGGAGGDRLVGGSGTDTVSYQDSFKDWLIVSLDPAYYAWQSGLARGDSFVSIERVVGSEMIDIIAGRERDEALEGRGGDDILVGGDGDDSLTGGAGRDILKGGDNITGEDLGDDRFYFSTGDGVDEIHGFSTGALSLDIIVLSLGPDFDTFGEVAGAAVDLGADVRLNFQNGDSITLVGVSDPGDLHEDDFLFA